MNYSMKLKQSPNAWACRILFKSREFFPGELHRRRSLMCYSRWGCEDLDTTKWLSVHACTHTQRKLCLKRLGVYTPITIFHWIGTTWEGMSFSQEYSLQLRQIMKELTASLVVLSTNSSLNRDLSNICLCLLKEQKDDWIKTENISLLK